MNKDILEEIIAHKHAEVAGQEETLPVSCLESQLGVPRPPRSLRQALASSSTGIIAEFKRRSPSKGWIHRNADAAQIPLTYQQVGAAALSILTDETYFGGSLEDIRRARPTVDLPILRKDFIISRYQLVQAKLAGADAILLIAAALTPQECRELTRQAHELGLEVLLELHGEHEIDYLDTEPDVVGINNRNLGTFHTDATHSLRLVGQLPKDMIRISESGISQPETLIQLRRAGFNGFLIGETFMKTDDPGKTLHAFIQALGI